jgi:hypothetical protein
LRSLRMRYARDAMGKELLGKTRVTQEYFHRWRDAS